jgi:NTE family protein
MKKLFILWFLIFSFSVFSQKKQPKIGLVLSGGGAKGFAHIGVLKEIDNAGICLDYIGGTSMGAIIGGLYAAGYTANQIEELVLKTDFLELIQDKLPRKASPFFDREFDEKSIISLPIINKKLGLPRGVSKGQNVLNMLMELFDSVDGNQDFSKLSVPFFCIATDVESGEEIILEKGSLPLALRASGSFPTLLNPIMCENKLLVDGGIANNFPVSIMRDKGIDIVIGVDVEGKLYDRKELNSALDILTQVSNYNMYKKSKLEKEKVDLYIHPNIYNYTVVDFAEKDSILEIGIKEARKHKKALAEIAKKQIVKKPRNIIKMKFPKLAISDIAVSGNDKYTRGYILGKLDIIEGDTLTRKEISKKVHLLSATKNFETIEYNLIRKVDNSYLLSFNVRESSQNSEVGLGVHYDFLYKSGLLVNYRKKNVFGKNDIFSGNVVLGDNLRYDVNYFVDNGIFLSYGFKSRFNHFRTNLGFNPLEEEINQVSSIDFRYNDLTNQLYAQTTFNRKFALGFGGEHKFLKATTETITTENEKTNIDNSHYLSLFGFLKLDTYDKRYFVTKGFYADLNFKWYLASSDFNNNFQPFGQALGTIGYAIPISKRLTFQNTSQAGFSLKDVSSNIFDFYLGGYNQNYINTFIPFYGYDFAELRDNSFLKTQFDFRYLFGEKIYGTVIANYAKLDSNVFKAIDIFNNLRSGYAIGLSYDSFVGPIEIKYSFNTDNNQSQILFNLGFWF